TGRHRTAVAGVPGCSPAFGCRDEERSVKLRPAHRARRFVATVFARRPGEADLQWANSHLCDAERRLFARMPTADRSHSIKVARRVEAELAGLGSDPSPEDR